jgi:hypothetical protein
MIVNTSFQVRFISCIIVAMTKSHGGSRKGSGRPKINGGVIRRNVGLTQKQIDYLKSNYGNLSKGIRALIDAAMAEGAGEC